MNNYMDIIIIKMDRPEHHGDWHDPLIRWGVFGPGKEHQKFSTRKEAAKYAYIRRHSASFMAAITDYAQS